MPRKKKVKKKSKGQLKRERAQQAKLEELAENVAEEKAAKAAEDAKLEKQRKEKEKSEKIKKHIEEALEDYGVIFTKEFWSTINKGFFKISSWKESHEKVASEVVDKCQSVFFEEKEVTREVEKITKKVVTKIIKKQVLIVEEEITSSAPIPEPETIPEEVKELLSIGVGEEELAKTFGWDLVKKIRFQNLCTIELDAFGHRVFYSKPLSEDPIESLPPKAEKAPEPKFETIEETVEEVVEEIEIVMETKKEMVEVHVSEEEQNIIFSEAKETLRKQFEEFYSKSAEEQEKELLAKKQKDELLAKETLEFKTTMEDLGPNVKHWTRDILVHDFTMAPVGGGTPLINKTTVRLLHGHKYALIGYNGAGKTTLLRHIENKEMTNFPVHLRVHLVQQEMLGSNKTVLETVMSADLEMTSLKEELKRLTADLDNEACEVDAERIIQVEERLQFIEADTAEFRASLVLDGLGFTDRMKNMNTTDLSGGWRMRVALACGLFIEPEILLLDEPTNHLDFPSVCWLSDYLQTYNPDKILVIVSHERSFLDEVCTDIIHLDKCKLSYYKGNYTQFHKTRTENRRHQATQYKRQQREIAHQEDFIRRFKANKKWSTQAQSRAKKLMKMKRIERVSDDWSWKFRFPPVEKLKNDLILDIKDMEFGYFGVDEKKETYLLKDVTNRIIKGTKVAVFGANGAGKSTLLKLVMKELMPLEGKCFMRNEVVFGYFAQHHMETIDLDATALQFLRHEFKDTSVQDCYAKLGRFNLSAKCARKKIRLLSGGEKSRLAFAILTWNNPHLIIMDEPTNHLDIPTQDALVGALKDYEGSLLIVSHDQHLLTEVCNEFWVVGNQTVTSFEKFDKAKNFCYNKCKKVDVLPREFSTINTKKQKVISSQAKKADPDDPLSSLGLKEEEKGVVLEVHHDPKREIMKGIAKGLTPNKILMHLKGWEPVDGDVGPLNTLAFDMLEKWFTDPEYKDADEFEFFEQYQKLLKFMVPPDHLKNQRTLITIAQSCWFTFQNDGFKKSKQAEALNDILVVFYQFEFVTEDAFKDWALVKDTSTVGRQEALEHCKEFLSEIGVGQTAI